jgi:hypothetical protein
MQPLSKIMPHILEMGVGRAPSEPPRDSWLKMSRTLLDFLSVGYYAKEQWNKEQRDVIRPDSLD